MSFWTLFQEPYMVALSTPDTGMIKKIENILQGYYWAEDLRKG